jgi:hypothetical protein
MLNQTQRIFNQPDSHLPVQTNSDHAKPLLPTQPRLNKSQTQLPASGNQNLLKSQTKFAVEVSAQEAKLEAYVSGQ